MGDRGAQVSWRVRETVIQSSNSSWHGAQLQEHWSSLANLSLECIAAASQFASPAFWRPPNFGGACVATASHLPLVKSSFCWAKHLEFDHLGCVAIRTVHRLLSLRRRQCRFPTIIFYYFIFRLNSKIKILLNFLISVQGYIWKYIIKLRIILGLCITKIKLLKSLISKSNSN